MLKLTPQASDWREILPASGEEPAVRILFAPIGKKAVNAARRAISQAIGVDPDDVVEAGDIWSRELLRRGIIDWEGVGDAAGNPLAVTPETIELFLADPGAFERADRAYVMPWALAERDRNVSPLLPAGTGAAGTQASDIAALPARPKPKGGASRTPKPAKAAPARTSNTNRKAKKGSSSGTSSAVAAVSSA